MRRKATHEHSSNHVDTSMGEADGAVEERLGDVVISKSVTSDKWTVVGVNQYIKNSRADMVSTVLRGRSDAVRFDELLFRPKPKETLDRQIIIYMR